MRSLRSILLTGGAGFVGSHLARHLLAIPELEHLVVLDTLAETGSRGNLIGLEQDPRIRFVEGDICDAKLITKLLGEMTATGVFHLASRPDTGRPSSQLDNFMVTNVHGTWCLLDACHKSGVPLLHCSNGAVYGSVDPPAKLDETAPLHPGSLYAASKASADLLCLAGHQMHGQDVVITRATNNYGPRQHDSAFIPTLVRHAVLGRSLPVPGNGMQIRDWMHVDDHCQGMIATFLRGPAGHVFNLSGQCERTNLGMARTILTILGKPESLINQTDSSQHDRRHALDTSKMENYFAWKPTIAFSSGFPSVVRELAANYSSASSPAPVQPDDDHGPNSRWAPPRKDGPPDEDP